MRPFPEDYELIGFFECEPEVLDSNVPWAFNQLKFESKSKNGTLIVEMETGTEVMRLKWFQDGNIIVNLDLVGVCQLEIGGPSNNNKDNTLIAGFRDKNVDALVLKIRPFISIDWGYNDHV